MVFEQLWEPKDTTEDLDRSIIPDLNEAVAIKHRSKTRTNGRNLRVDIDWDRPLATKRFQGFTESELPDIVRQTENANCSPKSTIPNKP